MSESTKPSRPRRARAAVITKLRADAERLHHLVVEVEHARRDLDATLSVALDCDVSVTQAAQEAALSRESVYQAIRRHEAWTRPQITP